MWVITCVQCKMYSVRDSNISILFPLSSPLQPVAELEVETEEISGQKDENAGQTAWPGDQVNSWKHIFI